MESLTSQQKVTHSALFKFLILEFVCLSLMIADKQYQMTQPIRSTLSLAAIPLIKMIEWPQELYQMAQLALSRQAQLIEDNTQLKQQLLDVELKSQQNTTLRTENERLRSLLKASQTSPLRTSVAFVANINLQQSKQHVVIDQGQSGGVFVGQPVLNLDGVIGQIDILNQHNAHIITITDPNHIIPVEVLRTGMRALAYGNGDQVQLKEIPISADVQVGDVIITSGFGNRFPRGLKLAEITAMDVSPDRNFRVADAAPYANLERLTEVFLVWPTVPGGNHEE